MVTAIGAGYAPPSCCEPGDDAPTGGFRRYKGDDWDGAGILRFQYGTLVRGVDGVPDTVTPIDITGFVPVGRLISRIAPSRSPGWVEPTAPNGSSSFTLTVAAGTARILDAPNGVFGFCPRHDITSQLVAQPDCSTMADATLLIAAKLIDSLGNLGTIAKFPILVLQA